MSRLTNDNYGYRSDDQDSLQTVIQTTGPAIDDEMAANYAAKLMTDDETMETRSVQTNTRPRVIDPTPVFDQESMQAMFASLGPAIDEPTYTHDWQ